ncbi:TPA: TrmH family RNA methyltransferase [Synechococcus sp. WH 5701]|uniref:TrmH family RNA methyltransferase n=1 Tax=Synechococcus sp. WH 5701 TaxID=69042 RepID=UPI003C6832CA
MPLLPRRFERIRAVLDRRMADLTVVLEAVDKPHNLSAILRSCDAVGVLEAHVVSLKGRPRTFNSTAQGSQKVGAAPPPRAGGRRCWGQLKQQGFRLYGTQLGTDAVDYRQCDFTGPTAFLLGAEKWGLSEAAAAMVDQALFIPTGGMVQSLNVSVAAAVLLFEALRQRQAEGLVPEAGEGLPAGAREGLLFEWAYPQVADWCRRQGRPYPALTADGEISEELPRTLKLRC